MMLVKKYIFRAFFKVRKETWHQKELAMKKNLLWFKNMEVIV